MLVTRLRFFSSFKIMLQHHKSYGILFDGVKNTRCPILARVLSRTKVLSKDEGSGGKSKTKLEEVREDGSHLHETAS